MMNIAVIGGGRRCRELIDLIERHTFHEINPKIVAVADVRDDAPGVTKAKEQKLFVTKDYNDFFERDDIDLMIELTGHQNVYNDVLHKKKNTVHAIDHETALLFWEISRISNMHQVIHQALQEEMAMSEIVMNDLLEEDVLIIAADYRIQDINNNMLKNLGLGFKEVIGRYCYEITHHQTTPCSGEQHPCPLLQVLKTRKPAKTTHIHLDKDKNELYYSIACYPVFKDGEVVSVIELSRDITKDMNMQKVMMQQEKMASVGRLSAGVAHEINNPLTTILTTAMLIQEDIKPEDPIYQDLQLIAKETLRCRKIVTSLLDFARQTQPEKKNNDVNEIVMESILLTKKQAAFNDISVVSRFAENIPLVCLDKGQIQQSLINLILNAVEATQPGGKITIETGLSPQSEFVEISVSDTGEGIGSDKIDKIFDPFFTTKENGTGLGLAITHGIIERHGGAIEVRSKAGQGTAFTIRFPISGGSNVC
jgi:nitrogen-specific signal transduction histidine kinase